MISQLHKFHWWDNIIQKKGVVILIKDFGTVIAGSSGFAPKFKGERARGETVVWGSWSLGKWLRQSYQLFRIPDKKRPDFSMFSLFMSLSRKEKSMPSVDHEASSRPSHQPTWLKYLLTSQTVDPVINQFGKVICSWSSQASHQQSSHCVVRCSSSPSHSPSHWSAPWFGSKSSPGQSATWLAAWVTNGAAESPAWISWTSPFRQKLGF